MSKSFDEWWVEKGGELYDNHPETRDAWDEAQKAMASDIAEMVQRNTRYNKFTYGIRERLTTGFLFEIKQYLNERFPDDKRI